jgi:Domain of Unknown Function (DUF1080)
MKRWIAVVLALLALDVIAFPYFQRSRGPTGDGWVTLFDGTNLDHWNQIGDANWHLIEGVVQVDNGKGLLVSKDVYGDFQIRVEFLTDPASASSIMIRVADPVLGNGGGFVLRTTPVPADPNLNPVVVLPPDPNYRLSAWHNNDITAKGSTFAVNLDGRSFNVNNTGALASGRIVLQYEGGGIVKFRKVEIRSL